MLKNIIIVACVSLSIFYCNLSYSNESYDTLKTEFRDWYFYIDITRNKKICYIYSSPQKSEGNYRKREEPYFLVKNIENDNVEITISSGFNYKKKSEVELESKNTKFNIFTFQNLAWAYNKSQDIDIVKEMRKNNLITIYSVNNRDKFAKDFYSLDGFYDAYQYMKSICNPTKTIDSY